jgi:hypothetical protein
LRHFPVGLCSFLAGKESAPKSRERNLEESPIGNFTLEHLANPGPGSKHLRKLDKMSHLHKGEGALE